MAVHPNYRERVYEIVRCIPRGRVMTYGQLAEILGDGYTPRTVGFVMHASDQTTPWHRVVNARGACSTARVVLPEDKQQRLLEAEGISFDERGCCKLGDYLWVPEQQQNELETPLTKVSLFNRLLISAKDKK